MNSLVQIVSGQVTGAANSKSPMQSGLTPLLANSRAHVVNALANLASGTELTVKVNAQVGPGLFLLTLGGQQIAARSNLALTAGDNFPVVVDRSRLGLTLKITLPQPAAVDRHSATETSHNLERQLINQALRVLLPRQQPINSLLKQLNQISGKNISSQPSPLVQPLLTQANDPSQLLRPQKLIQALTNSGVLLENKLLTTPRSALDTDIKASLLRALEQSPASLQIDRGNHRTQKLLREISESAIARIETQQLATVRDETGRRLITTDLILRDAERTTAVEVAIDRPSPPPEHPQQADADQQASTTPKEHPWRVTLNFDLPGTGKLQSLIRLDSSGLQVDFRSDQAQTREQLTVRFELLADRLAAAGMPESQFTVGVLSGGHVNHSTPTPTGQLLNLLS